MFENLLEKISLQLQAQDIPYMVIGGQAVLLYGEPRLTKDIDITLGLDVDHLSKVLQVVEKIGLKPLVNPEIFTPKTFVLPCQDANSGIRVDFIFSFSPYEREAIRRSKSVKMGKQTVQFASLEDLIIHKVVAGRPRDMEDVKGLLLKNQNIDLTNIRKWLTEFSAVLDDPCLKRFNELAKEIFKNKE